MVPQNRRARICTGRWRSSSVYQIQMLPRFFTTPASAVGCTRRVLKVPSVVLIYFAAFHLHGHRHACVERPPPGMTKLLPTCHGLRGGIINARQQVGEAAGDAGFNVLGLPGNQVLFIQNRFALRVIELERGVDLAAAFHGLLIELIGAALLRGQRWTGSGRPRGRAD